MADISPEQQDSFNRFMESVTEAQVRLTVASATITTSSTSISDSLFKARGDLNKLSDALKISTVNLGNLATALGEQAENTKKASENVEQAFENVAKSAGNVNFGNLNQSTIAMVEAFSKLTGTTHDQSVALLTANGTLNAFGLHQTEVLELVKIEKELKEKADKLRASFDQFATTLGSAGIGMFKALNKAETGTGKYADSVEKAAGATADWLGSFGPLGKIVGMLVNVMGTLVGESLRQNDALVKTYQSLSKIGQIDSTNLQELLNDLQKTGLSVQEVDKYVAAISKVSPELANLSSTVGQGRKIFAEVFGQTLKEGTQKELFRLGYTMEEAVNTTGSFIASLSLAGNTNKRTTASLNKDTMGYLRNLNELSALTGKSREEADKARRKQEEDLAFQSYLNTLGAEEQKKARLQVQAYSLAYGEDYATGAKSIIRTGGAIVDEFGAKILQSVGPQGIAGMVDFGKQKFANDQSMMDGLYKNLQGTAQLLEPKFKQFATQLQYGGADSVKEFGQSIETYRGMMAFLGKDEKALAEFRKNIAKKESGNRIELFGKQEQAERATRSALEQFNYTLGNITTPIIVGFGEVVKQFSLQIAKTLKWFGGPDLTGMFKTYETISDVKSTIQEEEEKQLILSKKKTRVEQELTEALEKRKRLEDVSEEFKKKHGVKQYQEVFAGQDNNIKNIKDKLASIKDSIQVSKYTAGQAKVASVGITNKTPTSIAKSEEGKEKNPLEGLKIKQGDVHREGSTLDPKLIELARSIQSSVPGFAHFNSFNDKYHNDNVPGSKHVQGKALDFALQEFPSIEAGQALVAQLKKAMPGIMVRDEYNNPSSKAIGKGHIHAELGAKTGGFFKGPESGYPVQLHGKEAVVPISVLKNFLDFYKEQNTPKVSDNSITKQPLSELTNSMKESSNDNSILRDLISTLSIKFDDFISEQRRSSDISAEILTYTKA